MKASWHFARHQLGGRLYNPLGGEHFNQGAVGGAQWEPGEALVREAIQNSLDAGTNDELVDVHLSVSTPDALPADRARTWFGTLWPHLQARECKLRGLGREPGACGFIRVEDFGTRGLEGNVEQWNSPRERERNDFFSFFRAEGHSGKSEKDGGSWGEGKSVFSRASQIHTWLAVSVRASDGSTVAIGKAVLWHHYINDIEHVAIGEFGERQPIEHGGVPGELVVPSRDAELLERLRRDFALRRGLGLKPSDPAIPGLSVIVPYADPVLTADSLLSTVVREYFEPILRERLRVTVSGHGLSRGPVILDHETILEEAKALRKPELVRLLSLATWMQSEPAQSVFTLKECAGGDAPKWTDSLFNSESPEFKDLCDRYNKGERVAVRVPLCVQPTDAKAVRSYFDVFLEQDRDGDGYVPIFVRKGIVVPNARERSVRGHSLFAIVRIDDQPLFTMLRAAEPPAHTTWSHTTQNFQGRYHFGKATIDFVVSAPKYIADTLAGARTDRDLDVWADFFPAPFNEGDKPNEGVGKRGKRRPPVVGPIPTPKPRPFKIEAISGGFSVARDNAERTPCPARLEVLVAYETSRGNALNKYHPADFKLSSLRRSTVDAEEQECSENRLIVIPASDDFKLEVRGFDENRDLFVKVRTLEISTGGDA